MLAAIEGAMSAIEIPTASHSDRLPRRSPRVPSPDPSPACAMVPPGRRGPCAAIIPSRRDGGTAVPAPAACDRAHKPAAPAAPYPLTVKRQRGGELMDRSRWLRRHAAVTGALVVTAALAVPAAAQARNAYRQTNLVSDQPGVAQVTDPNLVNAWGIAAGPQTPLWVADNGTNVATIYPGAA